MYKVCEMSHHYGFDIAPLGGSIDIDHKMYLPLEDGSEKEMTLRGSIDHGEYHFTTRYIDAKANVWYHDGQTTKSKCIHKGTMDPESLSLLRKAGERKASILIYGLE
jgi:hypothetical protein